MSNIAEGKVVLFHYTLTSGEGSTIDSSSGRDPLCYLHGAGNIVPGLEAQMLGRVVGDVFDAVVAPADGYGERQGDPQPVPRSAFPDDVALEPGMQFVAEGPGGQLVPLWISAVEDDTVYVDQNHPLAGETLHFAIEIVEIREASDEEVAHGHPHGPGGAHHHD